MRWFVRVVAVLAAAGGVAAAAPALASAATLVVGQDTTSCPAATYSSIQAAVGAASAGDTVSVCPGLYVEDVTVDKPLTLVGPGFSFDPGALANCGSAIADSSSEAVWESSGSAFRVAADNVSIRGFYLQPPSGQGLGPMVMPGYSGDSFSGNIFQRLTHELLLNADGAAASDVADNCFRTTSGSGLIVSGVSNATIEGNAFFSVGKAVYATGSAPVSGLTVQNNVSSRATIFAWLTDVASSSLSGNTADLGIGVVLGGGSSNVAITGNTLTNGAYGFTASSGGASPNTGIAVIGNTISRMSGAAITANQGQLTGSLIARNTVSASGYGIWMQAGDVSNRIQNNTASGDTTYDCADDTTGSATAGTANQWLANSGATSNVRGLCH